MRTKTEYYGVKKVTYTLDSTELRRAVLEYIDRFYHQERLTSKSSEQITVDLQGGTDLDGEYHPWTATVVWSHERPAELPPDTSTV
jgi:hypothetical protein